MVSSSTPASGKARVGVVILQTFGFLLGLAGLILEYGFIRTDRTSGLTLTAPPIAPHLLQIGQYVAIGSFILALRSQIALLPGRKEFFKDHLAELLLSFAAVAGLIAFLIFPNRFTLEELGWIRLGLNTYLVVQLLIAFIKFNNRLLRSVVHPARATLTGFAIVILVGALLLSLPCASYSDRFTSFGNNFVDNLFTSTSALCVTGLIVRDTGVDYTPFGQLIILLLIQLGGLGIIIFGTIFAMLIGRQVSLHETSLVMDIYSQRAAGKIRKVVKFIIFSTLLIEAVGAAFMYTMWPSADPAVRVYKSIFHAVSAFCNAGFALQTDNMIGLAGTWQVYLIVPALIIFGGLGFPVLLDIMYVIRTRCLGVLKLGCPVTDLDHFRVVRFTLQTKIALLTSVLLILGGTLVFFLTERPTEHQRWGRKVQYEDIAVKSQSGEMSAHREPQRLLDAFFLSVTSRTAGFNTVDTGSGRLHPASMIFLIILMTIGGSPASAAGGMKTVTFAILIATVIAALRHRPNVEIFNRTIDNSLIRRALSVSMIFISLVWFIAMALVLTHPQMNFLDLLFEASSACGTVGLSTGVTPHLSLVGRIIIIIGMFAGRLGPLTLLFAMAGTPRKIRYEFPREDLITG
jgi:trk system potassium uptake protein TrkH